MSKNETLVLYQPYLPKDLDPPLPEDHPFRLHYHTASMAIDGVLEFLSGEEGKSWVMGFVSVDLDFQLGLLSEQEKEKDLLPEGLSAKKLDENGYHLEMRPQNYRYRYVEESHCIRVTAQFEWKIVDPDSWRTFSYRPLLENGPHSHYKEDIVSVHREIRIPIQEVVLQVAVPAPELDPEEVEEALARR